jgi:hypothetical protein
MLKVVTRHHASVYTKRILKQKSTRKDGGSGLQRRVYRTPPAGESGFPGEEQEEAENLCGIGGFS